MILELNIGLLLEKEHAEPVLLSRHLYLNEQAAPKRKVPQDLYRQAVTWEDTGEKGQPSVGVWSESWAVGPHLAFGGRETGHQSAYT